jgi:hypothetical protein
MESEVMKEIRAIRDENSARHANMTLEEIKAEYAMVRKEFEERTGIVYREVSRGVYTNCL